MAKLGDYISQIRGVSYKPSDVIDSASAEAIPILRANNITYDGHITLDDIVWVSKLRVKPQQMIKRGDILVCASSGSKGLVGKAAQAHEDLNVSFGAFCKVIRPVNADEKYIGYYFQSPLYRQCISFASAGVNINNIRGEDIDSLYIDLPDSNEQQKRVTYLDKLSRIIALRKQQLKKLDELVKSQFIEMFGELGKDKKGWGLCPLGDCCEINPKKSNDGRLVAGLEVSFVPMPAVTENGEMDSSCVKPYEQVQTGFTYFAENDVLFAKITPCMENGKGAVARSLKNGVGFGSTEFHVLRPITGISNPAWIYAITKFTKFRQDAAKKMTGSAGQRRVPSSFLDSYTVSLPPVDLQNEFARFVEQTDKSKIHSRMGAAA